jgi:2,5-dihydroxypyridine 5,6-dioxygenase
MTSALPLSALVPRVRCALEHNLLLRPTEQVAIVWDGTVAESLYDAFRFEAASLGAIPIGITYEPLAYRPINEYALFAGRSIKEALRLPSSLREALRAADAFVLLCSDTELLFSPDLKAILADGRRGIFLPYMDEFTAHRLLFSSGAEVASQADLVTRVAKVLESAQSAQVTSNEGTDLCLQLGQYHALARHGISAPGLLLFLPPGNVARVPNDGSAEGTLVIDRTVCANDYKELHEPIALNVKKGNVVGVDGGMEARLLREFLASLDDPRAYHLTELAIGTNPLCKWSGIGAPSEDTHVMGTVAFALGCDTHIGGATPAPVHIDMTMRFPSLRVGDHELVRDGRLLISSNPDESTQDP